MYHHYQDETLVLVYEEVSKLCLFFDWCDIGVILFRLIILVLATFGEHFGDQK